MIKYVFIQNEPFLLPKVLDKYLRDHHDTTAGVNIQSVAQGKRTVFETAMELRRLYGFGYFQWKLRKYLIKKILGKIENDWLDRRSDAIPCVPSRGSTASRSRKRST